MGAFEQFLDLMPQDQRFYIAQDDNRFTYKYYYPNQIKELNLSGKTNVYFTPNSYGFRFDKKDKKTKMNKDKQHIEKLCCLYVDIDLKDAEDFLLTPEEVVEYAEYHLFDSEIPIPTMINCSGNGIHMYWAIEPLHYNGNIDKWVAFQKYIHSIFAKFGADAAITEDTSRYLRVPDTLNVKGENVCRAYNISFSDVIYNLDELIEEYEIKVPERKITQIKSEKKSKSSKKTNGKIITFNHNYSIFANRIADLERLLTEYRDKEGGKRECILFLYRYHQCLITQDTDLALERTLELNARLDNPLTEKECVRATRSAERYFRDNGLNWKNLKIINFLDIKESEMKEMKTLISHAEKKQRKKERNFKYYEDKLKREGKLKKEDAIILRQQKMYELMLQGKSRIEICEILNISRATYFNDKKAIKTEEWILNYKDKEIKTVEKTVELKKTGTDASEGLLSIPVHEYKRNSLKVSAPYIIPSCSVSSLSGGTRGKPSG